MEQQTSSIGDLRALADSVLDNPEVANNLDEKKLKELQEYLNPYKAVPVEKKTYACLSLINWRELYLQKFLMTSMIGFHSRLVLNYEPEELVDEIKAEYRAKVEGREDVTREEAFALNEECNARIKALVSGHRDVLKRFFARIYEFDPDRHVRRARVDIAADKASNDRLEKLRALCKNPDTLGAIDTEPPAELFYNFNRYLSHHYNDLRDITTALYWESPDFEYGVHFYGAFDTLEEANEFIKKSSDTIRLDVYVIENGTMKLLGKFAENRQNVSYFNKNTKMLEEMTAKLEQDHRLGKDMMEKRIKTAKARDVRENGLDAPGLSAYTSACNTVHSLGAKKVLTYEEQVKLAQAQVVKDMAEVPEDAIQVDVFKPTINADGEQVMTKTKFYTQAEAPIHMQPDSEYANKYQPKRPEGVTLDGAYTKTTSSSGKLITHLNL